MSLAEAVTMIVEEMEEEAGTGREVVANALRSYAKQLRVALKCDAGRPQQAAFQPPPAMFGPQTSENNPYIAAAREEFRKKKQEQQQLREPGGLVQLVGLPGDDGKTSTSIEVNETLAVGATPIIDNKVWRYEADGKLHYDAEKTAAFLKSRGQK